MKSTVTTEKNKHYDNIMHTNAKKNTKTVFTIIGIVGILSIILSSTIPNFEAYASHSFEAGVKGDSLPDNTHIVLDGIKLKKGEVLPLYDASPNFVSGHLLVKMPCNDDNIPKATVIAGHIDEHTDTTHVDKVPLYFISHASDKDSCTYHAHIPDPLNGGSPRVTDVDIVNYKGDTVKFNDGDVVDFNVQRVLGSISNYYEGNSQLPSELKEGNPVFDLNDDNPNNDGLGLEDE